MYAGHTMHDQNQLPQGTQNTSPLPEQTQKKHPRTQEILQKLLRKSKMIDHMHKQQKSCDHKIKSDLQAEKLSRDMEGFDDMFIVPNLSWKNCAFQVRKHGGKRFFWYFHHHFHRQESCQEPQLVRSRPDLCGILKK
jgi:hypothetical protein